MLLNRNFINLVCLMFISYGFVYFISFIIFGIVSVDTIIGIGILFLFYLFWFYGHKEISKFFLNSSKNIYILFSKLIYVVVSLKLMILNLNESYLNFLWYKFHGLHLTLDTIDFLDYKLILVKNFNINLLYNIFHLKLLYIDKFLKNNNYLNLNYLINDDNINLNLVAYLNLEVIIALKNG